MTVSVGEYRKWVSKYLKEPEKRRLANDALDAFERLEKTQNISAEEIRPIVAAAKCRFRQVWDIAADLLTLLSNKHSSAQDAMREMLQSKKVGERFQVIAALNSRVPKSLALELIRKALKDTGNRVREKAAERADDLKFLQLLPELEQALSVEKHPNAKSALEFNISMLRDGYLVEDHKKYITVTVRMRRGTSSQIISQEDIDRGRVPSIIADMRAPDWS